MKTRSSRSHRYIRDSRWDVEHSKDGDFHLIDFDMSCVAVDRDGNIDMQETVYSMEIS